MVVLNLMTLKSSSKLFLSKSNLQSCLISCLSAVKIVPLYSQGRGESHGKQKMVPSSIYAAAATFWSSYPVNEVNLNSLLAKLFWYSLLVQKDWHPVKKCVFLVLNITSNRRRRRISRSSGSMKIFHESSVIGVASGVVIF